MWTHRGGNFFALFFSGSAAFHGCLPRKRIPSLTHCLFLRPCPITRARGGDGFVLLFYCFWFGEFKTSEGCTKKRHKGTLRQNMFCPEVPLAPFLKRYHAFESSKSFTSPLPPASSGTSNRWLPGREHPSGKESPSLEPSGKALNAGYRKKQKSLHPPQVRSMRKA